MKIDTLIRLINKIELEKKYLFVVYDEGPNGKVGLDVLDYDDEEEVDGGWFNSVSEAYKYVSEFEGSL